MIFSPRPHHSLGRACTLAVAFASGWLGSPAARGAAYHPTAQEQSAIAKLTTDLQTIRAGSQVTDAEKQALAADLQVLTTGTTKPSQTSVEQLAEDLSTALADGSVSPAEEARLVLDVDAVFNSAGISTEDVQKFVADAQAILVSSGVNTADVQLVVGDLTAIASAIQVNFLVTKSTFALAPAPTAGSASGLADLVSTVANDGTEKATLAVSVLGLITGTYKVNATTALNASPATLGALTVVGPTGKTGAGTALFGDLSGQPFPAGFAPGELASVSLTDATGTAQLSGSVGAATKFTRLGNFRVVAGPAAPTALGNVAFKVKLKSSGTKNYFLWYAWQLPVSTTLTLKANGAAVGTVATDKRGRLVITAGNVVPPVRADGVTPLVTPTALPAGVNLSTLEFLELDNAQGQVVATAGFAP